MESTRDLLDAVLRWPAESVEAWLDGLVVGEPVGDEPFNWEVFAFTAATRAGEERNLPWAHIALRVYDGLVNRSPARAAHSFWLSAMNLRSRLIEDLGAREGDAVLDPHIIAAWFQRIATMPLEEAVRLSSAPDLRTVPPEKLLALRDIKNALNILSRLAETDFVRNHPELHGWIQLRSQLP
ncbi:hypothetical protein HUA74_08240 [Myxococcus sp. CA051A]|uniref:hypothetical protein n=1 Tax=unclassified Myxococcus TaxID=2648731 RepID=UPI00157A2F52|nr:MULTISPECIES: hypothetical protein [unclassified Myxococcus]NTX11377.1 hypothetical protein [Myxococcus sp. CA056]NTX55620.1 hypothetical protein [Myxococcus sp. CA039A]NTX60647.1 hypothetical protein [Myxococcus sp. CA051A]